MTKPVQQMQDFCKKKHKQLICFFLELAISVLCDKRNAFIVKLENGQQHRVLLKKTR